MARHKRVTCKSITKRTGRKHVHVKGKGCLTKRAARHARAVMKRKHRKH